MSQLKKVSSTIKTTVTYSKDGQYRYILEKCWDEKGKKAVLISLSAGKANEYIYDYTTMFIQNALSKEFGTVIVLNVFAHVTEKHKTDAENLKQIKEHVAKEDVDSIILCWGRGCENASKVVKDEIAKIEKIVELVASKCMMIADSRGIKGLHPLKAQNNFILKPWKITKEGDAKKNEV
ncbi:MAG: DUF1643 domain-containing protein [Clostridiales bacterium]|nr:DUF1643 domain-containing protein [Clostridiales bacterium]